MDKLPTDRPLDLGQLPAARVKMKKMVTAMLADMPPVEGVTFWRGAVESTVLRG